MTQFIHKMSSIVIRMKNFKNIKLYNIFGYNNSKSYQQKIKKNFTYTFAPIYNNYDESNNNKMFLL